MSTTPPDPYNPSGSDRPDDRPTGQPPGYGGVPSFPGEGVPEQSPYPDAGTPPPGYPSSAAQPPDFGAKPDPPSSILAAIKLMYVGAGLSALWTLLLFPQRSSIREDLEDPSLDLDMTPEELDTAANWAVGGMVILGLLTIGLWLWMAAVNRRGQSWGRIVATVLGSIAILFMLFSFVSLPGGGAGISIILNIALIGLAGSILWLLYRPDSSAYYNALSNRRRY